MIQLHQLLLTEIDKEAASTRKILSAVPTTQLNYKPHEKSMLLGRLATHVAELPLWMNRILGAAEFDMAANPLPRIVKENAEELVPFFDEKLAEARSTLQNTTNEALLENWTLRRGEYVISNATRYEAIRSWMMNHQVHHRGQLSVYLRLLDIPVPGMYGPSADDILARQAKETHQ